MGVISLSLTMEEEQKVKKAYKKSGSKNLSRFIAEILIQNLEEKKNGKQ
jgi:hypothetical protein